MSGESDDEPLVNVELSESSDGSDEHSLQEFQYPSPPEPSATIGPYYADGIPHLPPADEPILIPGLDQIEDSGSTTESGWTTTATFATRPIDNSSPKNKSFIHPISEGGSVTWKDHNEFVFHKGKDRGLRESVPTLPGNYKSKGPLPDFDFSKLRGNNVCMKLLFDSLATASFETDNCNRLRRHP